MKRPYAKEPTAREALRHWIFLRQCGLCAKCGGPMTLQRNGTTRVPRGFATFEHVRPLSRGGTNAVRNLLLTHASCNSRRRSELWRPLVGCIARSLAAHAP